MATDTISRLAALGSAAQFQLSIATSGLNFISGTTYVVIDANSITGAFANAAEGALVTSNGYNFTAHYDTTNGNFDLVDDRLAMESVLPTLDEREREVLRLRFVEELPQTEIAARIGCSQMQISRLLRRSLDRLREEAEGDPRLGEATAA